MASKRCLRCIKSIVIALCLLVMAIGVALIAMTAIARCDANAREFIRRQIVLYRQDFDIDQVYNVLYGFLVLGVITTIVGILGVLIAYSENEGALLSFVFVLLFVIVTKVAGGTSGYLYKDWFKTNVQRGLVADIKLIKSGVDEVRVRELIYQLGRSQSELKCCGCTNIKDYAPIDSAPMNSSSWWKLPNECETNGYKEIGCCTRIWNRLVSIVYMLAYGTVGFLVVEILTLVFTVWLWVIVNRRAMQELQRMLAGRRPVRRRIPKTPKQNDPIIDGHGPPPPYFRVLNNVEEQDGVLPAYLGPEERTYL